MLCPTCAAEMRVVNSQYTAEIKNGDTQIFVELTLACKNPKCTNKQETIVRNPV